MHVVNLDHEDSCSLDLNYLFPCIFRYYFLGTRSLEIEALAMAQEVLKVLEVDVLEDDAIFDLRPEGPSRRAISVVARGESQSQICTGSLAGPHLTMGLSTEFNTFQKQYKNIIQSELL